MAALLNPYLHFIDNAREALEYYKEVFGGELTMSTFGGSGMPMDPSESEKIMHGQLTTASGFTIMASDTPSCIIPSPGRTIEISLSGDSADELRGYWDKLADGGEIEQPLVQAPWGDTFGMLVDRFGIAWMVNILGS
ncbi:VOC family protein [Pseudoclavibacter helvolus]|uniref:VOC family protein n=1 Tax=Pseudoclavibacter helvolus TaxID=255205 RepID=UPI003736B537